MKAITLTQPWAQLVALGAKRIETRSWFTLYQGPVAIHAAKAMPQDAKASCYQPAFLLGLGWPARPEITSAEWVAEIERRTEQLPRGAVVATGRLVKCLPSAMIPDYVQPFSEQEREFGNYAPGRFGFLLDDIEMLPAPIAVKGALGLWEWRR